MCQTEILNFSAWILSSTHDSREHRPAAFGLACSAQTHPTRTVAQYVECIWQQYVFRLWRIRGGRWRFFFNGASTKGRLWNDAFPLSTARSVPHHGIHVAWLLFVTLKIWDAPANAMQDVHRATQHRFHYVPQKIYKYIIRLNVLEHDIGKNERRRQRII